MYQGIEVNILDHQNHLDIPEEYLKLCEFVIASIHSHMFPEKMDRAANTATYLEILKNPMWTSSAMRMTPASPVTLRPLCRRLSTRESCWS